MQRPSSIAGLVRSGEVKVQQGFASGTFAANILDVKYPTPATVAPVDPQAEAIYNRLLRDCVTFKPKPVKTEPPRNDPEVLQSLERGLPSKLAVN